jgi:hypothetical protein
MYQVNENKMDEHVAGMEALTNEYRVSVGKPERRRPLGRPRRGWKDT